MNITVKQLRAFTTVAQFQSFAEASERLNLSQPALSITIKNLEAVVGGDLFNRSTRVVALTPEGRHFFPIATRLLSNWDDACFDLVERFQKQRGKIIIASLPTMAGGFLPKPLSEFSSCYPSISICIYDALAENVQEMVQEERAEMGFTVEPKNNIGLNFETVLEDQYVVVCPIGHPLLEYVRVKWADLTGYPFVGIHRSSNTRQHIEKVIQDIGVKLDITCELSQIATVGRMVAVGMGISVLPALSLQQIGTLGIESRPLIEPEVSRPLGVITRDRTTISSAAEAFLSFIR